MCSIANMFRAMGRLIRAHQEQHILETHVQSAIKFQILTNVCYARAKLAADHAVNQSSKAGLGKEVQKSDVMTLTEEAAMLASLAASPLIASGLNSCMG